MGRFNYQTPERLNQFNSVPVGTILPFAGASIPAGWIECAGQAVSRTTYPDLFGSIGTTYGAGDGSTTFNLPDLRGEFLRGWDNGRGVDLGRTLGSYQADEFKSHDHPPASDGSGKYLNINGNGAAYQIGSGVGGRRDDATTGLRGGSETRPRNVAVRFCIRAFGSVENSGLIDVGALAVEVAGKAALSAFTGANQSLSASGWQKLPGGLILQWGSIASFAGNTTPAISFPIAFPTACLSASCSGSGLNNPANAATAKVLSWNASSVTIQNAEDSAILVSWFAIGH